MRVTIASIESSETAVLRFQTLGDLDVSDLTILTSSLEVMYCVFLTYRFVGAFNQAYGEPAYAIAREATQSAMMILDQSWPIAFVASPLEFQDLELVDRQFDARLFGLHSRVPSYDSDRHEVVRRSGRTV